MRHWCCSCCGHWGPHWPTTHPSCHSACYHGKSAVIGALAARHAPESIKKDAISKNDDANRHNAELMLNKCARTQILRVNDRHHVLGCRDKPARSYHRVFPSVPCPHPSCFKVDKPWTNGKKSNCGFWVRRKTSRNCSSSCPVWSSN